MEQIILAGEDGEDLPVYVLEETTVNGNKYVLVCDSDDEEGESDAFILKVVSEESDDVIYEMVEDDTEFDAVAKLFEELVGEDADFEY